MQPEITLSNLVVKHFTFLERLARARTSKTRLKLIQSATPEQLLVVSEIALNILVGDFELNTRQKRRLIPYADQVRTISRAKSHKSAISQLVKSGEVALLPALLLPVLIEAARYLIK